MEEKKFTSEILDAYRFTGRTGYASKARKTIKVLQQMKVEGKKIVQVCPSAMSPWFAYAADIAGCDILRLPAPADHAEPTITNMRMMAPSININFYMETPTYSSKEKALAYASKYMIAGADTMLPMGVSNETLKYMTDNYVPVYGHIGAISGWQTIATGYKKLGKTAEDAMRVFKMGYEYQENGMGGMTVELVPGEVSSAIAKKLRVPVLGIASGCTGGPNSDCDGYEMVDADTFSMTSKPASHAKRYGDFLEFAVNVYAAWADDVRSGTYPEEKHGWHMDPVELEKFNTLIEKF